MIQSQPIKTYRGTWDELMSHCNEIAPGAVLEVRVYEPETASEVSVKNASAIALLNQWLAEDATDDPEEIRRADAEVNELMENLDKNRIEAGERSLFS